MKTQHSIILFFIVLIPNNILCQKIIFDEMFFADSTLTSIEKNKRDTKNECDERIYVTLDDTEFFVYFQDCKDYNCSIEALKEYISQNLNYPASSIQENKEGTVVVSFEIDQNGKIDDIKILKQVSLDIDNEVLRVISNMPDWNWDSKIEFERRKNVYRVLPINFSLE